MINKGFPVENVFRKSLKVTTESAIKDFIGSGKIKKYHVSDMNYGTSISPSFSNNSIGTNVGRGYDSFIATQSTSSTAASFSLYVWGSIIGIGIYDNTTGFGIDNYSDATIIVDGIAFGLRDNCLKVTNPPTGKTVVEAESVAYINRIFKQDWHLVTVVAHANESGVQPLIVYNWFLEQNILQVPYSRKSSAFHNTGSLTTSPVSLPIVLLNSAVNNARPRVTEYLLEKIIYFNNAAESKRVTVSYNGVVVFQQAIPANTTLEFVPSSNGIAAITNADFSQLTHMSDVAGVIFSTVVNVQ